MKSLLNLFKSPYNKKYPLFALYRFIYWKMIRALKLQDVKFRVWSKKTVILQYNSPQSMWVMYNYIVDWEEFNLISRYVQPGDDVFDIGANIGIYTLWMSQFTGEGKVHSFEPDPRNFKKLQQSIVLNRLENKVMAHQKAVSDENGVIGFTSGLDIENHMVAATELGALKIDAITMESYMQEYRVNRISYLKIDVEGFEYGVLKGAASLLENKKIDIIQLEINRSISNSGKTINDLLTLLHLYQYHLCAYDVQANQLKTIEYTQQRENYFAVNDLTNINLKLKHVATN